MAVQAQYASNAFSPDFRFRIQNNLVEELPMLQGRDQSHQVLGSLNNYQGTVSPFIFSSNLNNNETVFSNPQSELTCIASGSKKRTREENSVVMTQNPLGFAYQNLEQSRLFDTAGASTSGRSSTCSPSPVAHDLAAHLYHQSLEIDSIIRLQNERLRMGLEQAHKRHCRALLSALEHHVLKKLKEMDAELEIASQRNAELEERVRQMTAENQIWFNVAKNNEAVVSSLRSSLEQVLQNTVDNAVLTKEGYGESDVAALPDDDVQSCNFDGEEVATTARERRWKCKVCGERDVSVLVLPCRHLSLCKDCEPGTDTCPFCHVTKGACLQIFVS